MYVCVVSLGQKKTIWAKKTTMACTPRSDRSSIFPWVTYRYFKAQIYARSCVYRIYSSSYRVGARVYTICIISIRSTHVSLVGSVLLLLLWYVRVTFIPSIIFPSIALTAVCRTLQRVSAEPRTIFGNSKRDWLCIQSSLTVLGTKHLTD